MKNSSNAPTHSPSKMAFTDNEPVSEYADGLEVNVKDIISNLRGNLTPHEISPRESVDSHSETIQSPQRGIDSSIDGGELSPNGKGKKKKTNYLKKQSEGIIIFFIFSLCIGC